MGWKSKSHFIEGSNHGGGVEGHEATTNPISSPPATVGADSTWGSESLTVRDGSIHPCHLPTGGAGAGTGSPDSGTPGSSGVAAWVDLNARGARGPTVASLSSLL